MRDGGYKGENVLNEGGKERSKGRKERREGNVLNELCGCQIHHKPIFFVLSS